jgi:23S rRNA-/tRNA-specific pseudouridylate synthase
MININKLKDVIAKHDICRKTNKRVIVYKRAYTMYFLRVNGDYTLMEMSALIGGKHHATMLHYKRIHHMFQGDDLYREIISELAEDLSTTIDLDMSMYSEFDLEFLSCGSLKDFKDLRTKYFTR